MDIFKQRKYLWIAVVLLVVLNGMTLTLLWLGRPGARPGPQEKLSPARQDLRLRNLLADQLQFNEEQIEKYLQLRRAHQKAVRRLQREIQALKRQMFDEVLKDNAPENISDSLLTLVLSKQADLERLTFQHFLDLKNLCGPQQKEHLQMLMREAFPPERPPARPGGRPGPPNPPPSNRFSG